ncbi:MAG: hypothetical protein NXH97_20585 [Rhodobacteraceae bacterium]|nr:hypothetical protein [Paracoccaceae bacterium]
MLRIAVFILGFVVPQVAAAETVKLVCTRSDSVRELMTVDLEKRTLTLKPFWPFSIVQVSDRWIIAEDTHFNDSGRGFFAIHIALERITGEYAISIMRREALGTPREKTELDLIQGDCPVGLL